MKYSRKERQARIEGVEALGMWKGEGKARLWSLMNL